MNSTELAIETGWYSHLNRESRFCNLCSRDLIGDEYHLIFVCEKEDFIVVKTKFLPVFCTSNWIIDIYLVVLLKKCWTKKNGVSLGNFLKGTGIISKWCKYC